MIRKLVLCIVLLGLVGIVTLQAVAESISGTVVDNTGQGLVQNGWVEVAAWNANDGSWRNDWAGGDYYIGLHPGEWHVFVNVHNINGYWGSTTKPGEEGQLKYIVTVNPGDELDSYNFEIMGVDNAPPGIRDIQVEGTPKAGEDIVVSAVITDDGGSTINPFWVYVVASRMDEDRWDWFGMQLAGDGRWRGHIPAERVTTAGVKYFLAASDYAHNQGRSPSDGEQNPLLIEVVAPPDATISGTVTDDAGNPLEGARVAAAKHENGYWAYTYANASGNYTLEVMAGTWTIHDVSLYEYYAVNPPRRIPGNPYGFQPLYDNIPFVNVGDNLTGYDVTMAQDTTPPEISFEPLTVLPSNGITIAVRAEDPESGVWPDTWNARLRYRFIDEDLNWHGWHEVGLRDWKYDPNLGHEIADGVFEANYGFWRTGIIEYYFVAWNTAGVSGTNPSPQPNDDPRQEPHGNYAAVIAGYTPYTANYRDANGNTTFNGALIGPGTIVSVANSEGSLCGAFVTDVTAPQANPGEYGFMTVYGDDPDTSDFNEGMLAGETPRFFIFDEPNRRNTLVQILSGDAAWQQDATRLVDLIGVSAVWKSIEVDQNWNLIGIAGTPFDEDTSVPSVLRSIKEQYSVVIGYDSTGAILYDPEGDPSLNTMTHIDDVHGFYLHMYSPATINLEVFSTVPSTPIPLTTGWNLSVYLPTNSRSVSTALSSIDGKYDWVKALYPRESGSRAYDPSDPGHSTLQEMKQPFAYFILMNQGADLVYDSAPAAPSARPQPGVVAERPVVPSTSMVFLYGEATLDGQPAPKGTVVTAFDPDGTTIGRCIVREPGKFGYMAAYRDEVATPTLDEGAHPGDSITFAINGSPASSDRQVVWTQFGDRIQLNLSQSVKALIPDECALWQNYPNPFNPETWIPYQLAEPSPVNLLIYSLSGEMVRQIQLGMQPPGVYVGRESALYWDGRNDAGESVASGVYVLRLQAGDFSALRKVVLRK